MAKYRRIPVVVDAIQWTGDNDKEVKDFIKGTLFYFADTHRVVVIKTTEGNMQARVGDYIIRDTSDENSEYIPCRPDVFEKYYEKVEK